MRNEEVPVFFRSHLFFFFPLKMKKIIINLVGNF